MGIIFTLNRYTRVSGQIPDGWKISVHWGREQPFTVWQKVTGKVSSKPFKGYESVYFCRSWYEALCCIRDDAGE